MPVYCVVNGQSNIRMIRFHWFVLLNIIARMQTMLPCPALPCPALIHDPQLGSAPLIEWADRLAFLIEFQEHLISGQALRAEVGLEATTTTAFDLRELAQWSVRSDAMCLRNYHYGRSANMTEQHRKEEWKREGREREGEREWNFWLLLLPGNVFARCWHLHNVGRRWANGKLLI